MKNAANIKKYFPENLSKIPCIFKKGKSAWNCKKKKDTETLTKVWLNLGAENISNKEIELKILVSKKYSNIHLRICDYTVLVIFRVKAHIGLSKFSSWQ